MELLNSSQRNSGSAAPLSLNLQCIDAVIIILLELSLPPFPRGLAKVERIWART